MASCLWIVFDGIGNSIFKSQVLEVAIKQLDEGLKNVTIASFESNPDKSKHLLAEWNLPTGIEVKIFGKSPILDFFLGSTTTEIVTDQIVGISPSLIIARGPLSARHTIKALRLLSYAQEFKNPKFTAPELIIQARGLLAEEYWYRAGKKLSFLPLIIPHYLKYRALKKEEMFAYSEKNLSKLPLNTKVEVITGALEDHLVQNYGLSRDRCFLSTRDLPKTLTKDKIKRFRAESRSRLGLENERVYTFSYSDQPWQNTKDVIKFFSKEKKQYPNAILLVLAWNPELFERLARKVKLSHSDYIVIRIDDPLEYQKVLCASDVGVIFRDTSIVNMVARPVKAMDYFAAGLEIVHNGTVHWIVVREKLRQRAKRAARIHHEKALEGIF